MENITKKKLKKNWQKFKKEILDESESNEDKVKKVENIQELFNKSNKKNILSKDNIIDVKSILYLLESIVKTESDHISFNGRKDYSRLKRLVDDLDMNRFLAHSLQGMGGNFMFNILDREKAIKYLIKRVEEEISFLKKKDNFKKFGWLIKDVRNLIIGILITVVAGLILYILIGGNN